MPAAAARNVARGTRSYLVWSIAVAFLAGAGGLGVSTRFLVPTGGAVVLAVSAIFFLTLAARSILPPEPRMTAARRRDRVASRCSRCPRATELGNVVRFGMVVVIGVWMFLATDSATVPRCRRRRHAASAAVSGADAGSPADRAADVPRAAGGSAGSRDEARRTRRVAGGVGAGGRRHSAVRARSDREGRAVRLAPDQRAARSSTISGLPRRPERPRGWSSSRNPSRERRPIPRARTKSTTG